MRFACQSCGRAYAVAGELAGRSFKMKCKSCGHMIVVRPPTPVPAEEAPASPPPPAEPHPLATPFVEVAGAAGVAVSPPPPPISEFTPTPAPVRAAPGLASVPVAKVAVAPRPATPVKPAADDESDPFSGLMELKTAELQLLRRTTAPDRSRTGPRDGSAAARRSASRASPGSGRSAPPAAAGGCAKTGAGCPGSGGVTAGDRTSPSAFLHCPGGGRGGGGAARRSCGRVLVRRGPEGARQVPVAPDRGGAARGARPRAVHPGGFRAGSRRTGSRAPAGEGRGGPSSARRRAPPLCVARGPRATHPGRGARNHAVHTPRSTVAVTFRAPARGSTRGEAAPGRRRVRRRRARSRRAHP